MAEWLIKFAVRYRLAVILVWVAATVALGVVGVWQTEFSSDYRVYFAADNPELLAYEEIERTYTSDDTIFIALQPVEGSIFTPETLSLIEEMTEAAWQIPHAMRVDSLTNFQHMEASEDDLLVGNLVEDATGLSSAEISRIEEIAMGEPALVDRLIGLDGRTTGMLVTLSFPGNDHREHVPQSVDAARVLIADLEQANPGVRAALAGTAMISRSLDEMTLRDLSLLSPILYLILLVILAILLRSIGAMFAASLVITVSAVGAMGVAAALGITLTTASAMAPIVVLTLAVADSVHLISNAQEARRDGMTKPKALSQSMGINLEPITLTSLTTLIGFLSLNFSASPPFHDLGNITAIGVVFAWSASLTFLPAVLSYLPWGRSKPLKAEHEAVARFSDFVVIQRRAILVITALAAVLFTALVPLNRLDDQVVRWFGERTQIRQDTDFITDNLTGPYRMDFSLHAAGEGEVVDPAYLMDVERFASWLLEQPEVTHVDHFADVMKRLNRSMHGDDQTWYRLPEVRDMAAQYLLLYELSLPYGLDLTSQVSFNKSATRLTMTMADISSAETRELKSRAEAWATENLTHASASEGSGTAVMYAFSSQRTINSMLLGTAMAFLLISLTLVIALRSWRLGLLSLLPNVLPVVITFGIWAIFVGQVGVVASAIAAITLGLVVDDTVHFLSKYHRARKEHRLSVHDGIRFAFEHVSRALITTTVVLAAGFSVLMFSDFLLNFQMGILTVMTITLALVLDFFLLPALLMFLDREKYCACRTCAARA